jgi:hypothetical protein
VLVAFLAWCFLNTFFFSLRILLCQASLRAQAPQRGVGGRAGIAMSDLSTPSMTRRALQNFTTLKEKRRHEPLSPQTLFICSIFLLLLDILDFYVQSQVV